MKNKLMMKTTTPNILIIGLGGAGISITNKMINDSISNLEYVAIDTNLSELRRSDLNNKFDIGRNVNNRFESPNNIQFGKKCMKLNSNQLLTYLKNKDVVLIVCGMGGRTGTGAAIIISQICKKLGLLHYVITTRPFYFEGYRRQLNAENGLDILKETTNELIITSNQSLLADMDKKTLLTDAFKFVDTVLSKSSMNVVNFILANNVLKTNFVDLKKIIEKCVKVTVTNVVTKEARELMSKIIRHEDEITEYDIPSISKDGHMLILKRLGAKSTGRKEKKII